MNSKKEGKNTPALLILDDLISSGVNMRVSIIANLYTSFRHCNISVLFLT